VDVISVVLLIAVGDVTVPDRTSTTHSCVSSHRDEDCNWPDMLTTDHSLTIALWSLHPACLLVKSQNCSKL